MAFLFNLHSFYAETLAVCKQAKLYLPESHNCHRQWAFALFKRGDIAGAVKKIKKGLFKKPRDADNWVMWGVILKEHGSYRSSKHKFIKALKIDPHNQTASDELQMVEKAMELDKKITI